LNDSNMTDATQDRMPRAQASETARTNQSQHRELLLELAETRARLEQYQLGMEAMINSLGEGLIVLDDHGAVTTVNDYALRSLGFSREELEGRWFPGTIIAVDQYSHPLDPLTRPIIRALTTGQTISDHMYYLRQDEAIIPVFVTVSPILMDGKPVGAIEVFRDLTHERQLDIAKDEFVSLASHQLRTPATGVMTILSMLAAGDFGELQPLQQKYVQKAVQSNNRQLQIIEDLLNVAKVDAGRMELDIVYADLVTLIREVISDSASVIEKRQQVIELNLPPKAMMFADVAKLRMVIDNLISNASKYSSPGKRIQVTLQHHPKHLVFMVRDEGVGIPPAEIAKLGTKFTRLENELSLSVGGSGLGLFLARSIIDLHQGSLAIESIEGQGSTFTVMLPFKQGVSQ
jgi:PAS domain S-box-containing protein